MRNEYSMQALGTLVPELDAVIMDKDDTGVQATSEMFQEIYEELTSTTSCPTVAAFIAPSSAFAVKLSKGSTAPTVTFRKINGKIEFKFGLLIQPRVERNGTISRSFAVFSAYPVVASCLNKACKNYEKPLIHFATEGGAVCNSCRKDMRILRKMSPELGDGSHHDPARLLGVTREKILEHLDGAAVAEPFNLPRIWASYIPGTAPFKYRAPRHIRDILEAYEEKCGLKLVDARKIVGTFSRGYRGVLLETGPFVGNVPTGVLTPHYNRKNGEAPVYWW